MRLKYHRQWLLVGWSMILLVWYLSLTPRPPELGIRLWDKLNHFIAYAGLMGWFGQLYTQTYQRIVCALAIIAMGIAIEFFQGLGGVRMFEYRDMLANTLGVIMGWLSARALPRSLFAIVERRLPGT